MRRGLISPTTNSTNSKPHSRRSSKQWAGPGLTGTVSVGSCAREGERSCSFFSGVAVSWSEPGGRAERGGDEPVAVVLFVLDGRDVVERFVQAGVVEPADGLDDRQLEL